MLVLLTKRKLRPDGFQTVKPPGILAMPNIFSPPFFFFKNYWDRSRVFWGSQKFFHAARKISHVLSNLFFKFSSLLFFSFTGSSSHAFFPWYYLGLPLELHTAESHTHGLQTMLHWGASEAEGEGLPWPHLAPSPLQPPVLPGWDKEFPLQAESYRVNLPGVLQEILPTTWLLLVCSKQMKSRLKSRDFGCTAIW